jgi:hypothetical protein
MSCVVVHEVEMKMSRMARDLPSETPRVRLLIRDAIRDEFKLRVVR